MDILTENPVLSLISYARTDYRPKPKWNIDSLNLGSTIEEAWYTNQEATIKAAAYFAQQQPGRDMHLVIAAVLHDQLSELQMLRVLVAKTKGLFSTVDLIDPVKVAAWIKFYRGKDEKLSRNFLWAARQLFIYNPDLMAQVLRYKGTDIPYCPGRQIGIIDLIGMMRGCKKNPLPQALITEYDQYLYPRYRQQQYWVKPVSPLGISQYKYFKKQLPPGVVPYGITYEQVQAHKDEEGLRTLRGLGITSSRKNRRFTPSKETAEELLKRIFK